MGKQELLKSLEDGHAKSEEEEKKYKERKGLVDVETKRLNEITFLIEEKEGNLQKFIEDNQKRELENENLKNQKDLLDKEIDKKTSLLKIVSEEVQFESDKKEQLK